MKNFDFPYHVFKYIDKPLLKIVYSIVDISLIKRSLRREKEFFVSEKEKKQSVEFFTTMLNAIHSRASAAISHISIMMGVTVLLISREEVTFLLKSIMLIEVGFYVFLLLLSLICVRSMTLNNAIVFSNFKVKYRIEVIKRFAILQVINSCLVIATIVFFILVCFAAISFL